jgi:hypothetical protein
VTRRGALSGGPIRCDSKLQALMADLTAALAADASTKALVFGQYGGSMAALESMLTRGGVRYATIKGNMTQTKRSEAIKVRSTTSAAPVWIVFICRHRAHWSWLGVYFVNGWEGCFRKAESSLLGHSSMKGWVAQGVSFSVTGCPHCCCFAISCAYGPRGPTQSPSHAHPVLHCPTVWPPQAFQGDPSIRVFLLSVRAGAVGITLTAARLVYLLEPCLNPSLEEQAVGRAWRLGQQHHVTVKRLVVQVRGGRGCQVDRGGVGEEQAGMGACCRLGDRVHTHDLVTYVSGSVTLYIPLWQGPYGHVDQMMQPSHNAQSAVMFVLKPSNCHPARTLVAMGVAIGVATSFYNVAISVSWAAIGAVCS